MSGTLLTPLDVKKTARYRIIAITLYGIKKESKNVKGHTKRTFNDNNILTVHNLASYFTITCMSQIRLARTPNHLYELMNIDDTRTKPRMMLPMINSSHLQNNFLFMVQRFGI